MFFGEYEHSIDDKSRLTLPARFRDALADGVVLSKGLDGSVDVYPKEAWQMTIADAHRPARPARCRRRARCSASSSAVPPRTRPTSRAACSCRRRLVRYGKLAKDVTVVGSNDHLEIWDRAAWAERLEGIEGSADNVAERLAEQRV